MRARIFAEDNRKWFTLAAVSFGLFMIMLDNTVVNVALPSIQRDLGTDLSSLQWIVTGYALTFGALMLIGGKVADAYGRRLIFVVGISVFTTASLWCGLADSGDELIAARILQGVGAALMNPATLSIIAATFPSHQRGTAIGIWAGVSALALAIGPLVGGLLTEHLDWSWIFFVNIPVGILAIAASFLFIDESRDETHVRLDLPGLATSAVGLFALTYALIEANTYGWTSPRILGAFAVAGMSILAFILLERYQRAPMLPLELFKSRTYAGANMAMLLVALSMFGVFFFLSLYMQNVLGYSAVQTGAAFLPMTILIILIAPVAGKTSDRFGSRGLMTTGMILIAVQLLYFSRLGVEASFWSLLPAFLVGGVGMALTMTPSAAAATRSVSVDKAGVGAAVLNASRQVGGSLGIALIGAIIA
ncbi:MAG: DHA2 family efflux MFS transporter permease subunit, partial [Actinobacteria bacterium]|nr:DHA2 family efflux MFS transporter permease subunit [Actinomycetota bacterium]